MTKPQRAVLLVLLGGAVGVPALQTCPLARHATSSFDRRQTPSSGPTEPVVLASSNAPLQLGATAARIALTPTTSLRGSTLAAAVEPLGAQALVALLLRGVHAANAPGILYQVYLDLPLNAVPDANGPHFVGTLNFFNAVPSPGADASPADDDRFVSYDITDVAKSLRWRTPLSEPMVVTIVPVGRPAANAGASIARLEIVVDRSVP
jgi:hypothetical protein